jgi:glycosyltransferase involved in cell wall biosynthesis
MEGGGAERQLTYLAKELVVTGCEIHVALTRGGQNLARLEATGATIHALGPCGNHDPRIGIRLLRTIAAVKPDLVQCWLLQMELVGGLACVATGTPWIFAERSCVNAYPRTLKNFLRVRIASFASGIVSNSAAGDEYWRARATRVRRYVVGNAVPIDEIEAAPVATAEEAGTLSGNALILSAGRLDAAKNGVMFVQAIHRLPRSLPVHAALCGDGPMQPEIEQLIAQAGPQGRVRLVGYASNLWSLMKRAAVLVSVSRFEGNPNVVLEAMACGCPLIVSDIPAHRELLDEECAVFVADDPDPIARAIEQVIGDPVAAARRAAVARQRVGHHAPALVAARYLAVYREVVSRQARGSREVAV